MANSNIVISADTGPAKKSILELSKAVKSMSMVQKMTIFSASDRKFMASELPKSLADMKSKLKSNSQEIRKMVSEHKSLIKGSEQELALRKKILESYSTQAKLGKEIGNATEGSRSMLTNLAGGAAAALIGLSVGKVFKAVGQYTAGASNRVRLQGLGMEDKNMGSASQLAKAGLTEQDLISRRIAATSTLGRQGSSNSGEIQKASFERAFGLQGGTMTNSATALRSGFGGQGADQAQAKLQASILASGIEDAIGPYLETMTSLLSSINEDGTTATGQITNVMAQLTKNSPGRTPEQMSKTFGGINSAIQNSSGEANAFLQSAFGRAGIGGGTIGGTRFAMESGGLFGLNRDSLSKRGYNSQLLGNMGQQGMFSGMGERTDALVNQLKLSGGLKSNQKIGDITNTNQMVGMNNVANSVFGTKGMQGFDAAKLLEQVQTGKMTGEEFEKQVQAMKDGGDPQVKRLDRINASLAGQTDVLTNIDVNLSEALGRRSVSGRNALKQTENGATEGLGNIAGAIDSSGMVQKTGNAISSGLDYLNSGGLGSDIYDMLNPSSKTGSKSNLATSSSGDSSMGPSDFEKAMSNALKKTPITTSGKTQVNVKSAPFRNQISDKTHK